jgi:transposase
MTKPQVEVITSVQRRRRWPISEKERIIAAALEPGAVASEVARAAGIHVSQLFRWRQQLCGRERAAPTLAPVAVVPGPGVGPVLSRTPETIEIEFGRGVRMRITGAIDASIVKLMVGALAKIGRRR